MLYFIIFTSLLILLYLLHIYLSNKGLYETFKDKATSVVDLNTEALKKNLVPVNLTPEALPNLEILDKYQQEDYDGNLCSLYSSQPMNLNEKCNSLTEGNCKVTSCCVWLNGKSCQAGDASGPTFRTKDGKPIDVDNYYFMGKFYGK
jgi:hypothetical protein